MKQSQPVQQADMNTDQIVCLSLRTTLHQAIREVGESAVWAMLHDIIQEIPDETIRDHIFVSRDPDRVCNPG